MTTPAVLLTALVLDALLGEPRWLWSRLPHPAVVMGRAVGWLDTRMNTGGARRAKGTVALVVLVALAWVSGQAISHLGTIAEAVAAAILLAQRSLIDHVAAVARGMRQGTASGRAAVAMIVSRDTSAMDDPAVARAAIESAAENLSDGVIAPAFWFALGGLPGLCVYKVVNTADSMIGYRTPRHEDFGWAAARLDDLLNLGPARATALLIALVGRVSDLRGIARDARLHRSPNAGWPEAAMARALGCALAGPRSYDGTLRDFPFVHATGRKDLGPADIDAAIAVLWRSWAAVVVLCACGAILLA